MLTPSDFRWFVLEYRNASRPAPPFIVGALEAALKTLAPMYKSSDASKQLTPSDQHAGYLTATHAGWVIHVPWPIARYIPPLPRLAEILAIGTHASAARAPAICVSGSCALGGANLPTGDLDFCQYIEEPPSRLVVSSEEFLTSNSYRVLVRAQYGDDKKSA